ncbi:uroporphyrinogen-III C-methyltransferase [Thalassotalea euphylliae]|uniref:uroporphyrinogen-III C-methyltransferase n=1 Tax=Thalassotalea euphylliae TaxID=1655234 RepID=A0A3E0TU37_9GAMM|nr:uroporphyrinogen-III C-methyltransferase [Thalassotalea euphylliae]REL27913.1 uroporphyrinogen-III C-methyltransferase [Thalassotalea euphylliae]
MPKNFNPNKQTFVAGEAALVGAGPGDPDLLTLQAYRFITQADVAIYDRLVSDEIMALLPQGCEKIYVGKKQADHKVPQERINEIIVEQAKLGKRVVRLKGGDPLVFGRGGEEAQYALSQGVACHIVPGMTAASSCAAYAGIPLTHRQVSRACTLITGHVQSDGSLDLPWSSLQDKQQTIVFYMGVKTLGTIVKQLEKAGRPLTTPVALIERGTTQAQKLVKGTLANIESLVTEHNIKPPSLIIIGDVVNTFEHAQLANLGYLTPSLQG